jgi:hypothetical protein
VDFEVRPGGGVHRAETSAAQIWWKRLFQPLRFDQTRQEGASYVQEEDDPVFGFTLGMGDLADEGSGSPQNLSTSEGWGLSTGIVPIDGMQPGGLQIGATDRQYFGGRNSTGSRVWPDLQFRWSPSAFPGFLDRWVRSATLTSNFEREALENSANALPLSDSDRHSWDPIVGLTMTWGNGLMTDLRATTSNAVAQNIRGDPLFKTSDWFSASSSRGPSLSFTVQ